MTSGRRRRAGPAHGQAPQRELIDHDRRTATGGRNDADARPGGAVRRDPFQQGWNLFGTADFEPRYGIVGAGFVWYSQVALIVAGHVIAVYLAHSISLRLLRDPGRALKSQLPMLVLMVLYTMTSLWILAQPIVE
jgi:hypothetical protein